MTPRVARIAVTGAQGRLGSALVIAIATLPDAVALPWSRPAYDLDRPESARLLVADGRPTLVVHPAAWTDVDGCARDPATAMRRNADAVGELAAACAAAGSGLVLISTNEVFDGGRSDGLGYIEDDATGPRNAYGESKLAGEGAARAVFGEGHSLWIIRTAWLYGPPGSDFPHKILAAADRLPADAALPVVADEFGSPTFTHDLAAALLALVAVTDGGLFHLAGEGAASRLEWAQQVLLARRPDRLVRPITRADFQRASEPPPWGVLDTGRAASLGIRLPAWQSALARYLGSDG